MKIMKEYLGDGLYAEFDGYQFRLFTDRGMDNIHEVYLEPVVIAAFLAFIKETKTCEQS